MARRSAPSSRDAGAATAERLTAPGGGEVELALDEGEIVAGEARAPIREAELELVSGEVGALYASARLLFPTGPVRLAPENKAARGYRLARTGVADLPQGPRGAGTPRFEPVATVETAARDVLRDCLGQIAANMALVADSAVIEGPHQLRVGLRRLRTAWPSSTRALGSAGLPPLAETARDSAASRASCATPTSSPTSWWPARRALGPDPAARAALTPRSRRGATRCAHASARRSRRQGHGSSSTSAPSSRAAAGSLASDYSQTARLAAPIGEVAPGILARRHKKAMKLGRKVRELDAAGLHQLRKELKKLRYTVDMFAPLYGGARMRDYLRALKELQDSFGSLNDAVMAGEALTGPDAPGGNRPRGAAGRRLDPRHAGREGGRRPAPALRALGPARRHEALLALRAALRRCGRARPPSP